jgi:hypothetical protein
MQALAGRQLELTANLRAVDAVRIDVWDCGCRQPHIIEV